MGGAVSKYLKTRIAAAALVALLLGGCKALVAPMVEEPGEASNGDISLFTGIEVRVSSAATVSAQTSETAQNSRTIVPSGFENKLEYLLRITYSDGSMVYETMEAGVTSRRFLLESGAYSMQLLGFTEGHLPLEADWSDWTENIASLLGGPWAAGGKGHAQYVAATGTAQNAQGQTTFNISKGDILEVTVPLSTYFSVNGTGTLLYNIELPSSMVNGQDTATVVSTNNVVININLLASGFSAATNLSSGSATVDAGMYNIQVSIIRDPGTVNERYAGYTNTVHIVSGMTSYLGLSFKDWVLLDKADPGQVTGLTAVVSNGVNVTLSWTPPSAFDYAGSIITFTPTVPGISQPIFVPKTGAATESYAFNGLEAGITYTFSVVAIDNMDDSGRYRPIADTPVTASITTRLIIDVGALTEPAARIQFGSSETMPVDLVNMSSHDIYMAKVNQSGSNASGTASGGYSANQVGLQPSQSMRSINPLSESPASETAPEPYPLTLPDGQTLMMTPKTLVERHDFHDYVEPYYGDKSRAALPRVAYSVGQSRNFWVRRNIDASAGSQAWESKPATLRATGTYCDVWVMNSEYPPGWWQYYGYNGYINTEDAEDLRDNFDALYPHVTNLLGYERGGGPSGNGGVDENKKVQILVYEFNYDWEAGDFLGASSVTMGYYWSKDEGNGANSNHCEMFYIDSWCFDFMDFIEVASLGITSLNMYLTLAHEFQHMINNAHGGSESALNEMMSMMTEDFVGPYIGFDWDDSGMPIESRMPGALNNYYARSVTNWTNNDMTSYSNAFAFGAYLARNYGGAEFLSSLSSSSNRSYQGMINYAMQTRNPSLPVDTGVTNPYFRYALARYPQAWVFSSSSYSLPGTSSATTARAFDYTVNKTVGGESYEAHGFDVYEQFDPLIGDNDPTILFLTDNRTVYSYGITVHTDSSWQNKSGNMTVELKKPTNTNVEIWLLFR
ncbi:MAG: fibronectin type III domain-containing protein [Spirochaetaceae bacterium]|jgi:hypothetical protein|nr:fibronectin type III domain-containing protein [Spirochaetaceae bacterium]